MTPGKKKQGRFYLSDFSPKKDFLVYSQPTDADAHFSEHQQNVSPNETTSGTKSNNSGSKKNTCGGDKFVSWLFIFGIIIPRTKKSNNNNIYKF